MTTPRQMLAYGANMHLSDMRHRAPKSVRIGIGKLDGWRIGVNSSGWLGIAPEETAHVWGVLYTLGAGDEPQLDAYEAVNRGLYRKSILEVIGPEQSLDALVYVPNEPLDGIVRSEYLKRCIAAAMENNLPSEWIEGLRELATTQP